MPDLDPASRGRTEKAKTLDSRFRGNDDWDAHPSCRTPIRHPEQNQEKFLDPRLKTSGMTIGGLRGNDDWGRRWMAKAGMQERRSKGLNIMPGLDPAARKPQASFVMPGLDPASRKTRLAHKRGAPETPRPASVAIEDILCEQTMRRDTGSRRPFRRRRKSHGTIDV